MHNEIKIILQPSGRTVHVLPGTTILEAVARAGAILHTPCGGSGTCGKCRVRIRNGQCPPTPTEATLLGSGPVAEGVRLACLARITSPLTVEVPESSLFESCQQILTGDTGAATLLLSRVRKQLVTVAPASPQVPLADVERLRRAGVTAPLGVWALQALPGVLRAAAGRLTPVEVDGEIIGLEPGDTTATCHGIAFDIGTTTLVGTLVDLVTGVDLAVASRVNPQTALGDDVIARIQKCRDDAQGLAHLQAMVLEGVNRIIDDLARKTRVGRHSVYEVVFAGNTAMQQILCGLDPSALGEVPFAPAFREALEWRAADLRLHVHPGAKVYVFPQIGGFVGGDTTAGILATRLDRSTTPTLLVDIGTNGEIVLAHQGRLLAASVAAGPAFEGARIANGMRAVNGAIEKVILGDDVHLNVIGNARPAGLCGTGLIDAAAELLRTGILDPSGRFRDANELPASLPQALRTRLVEAKGETHFQLVRAEDSATGTPLLLYQRDIRELQLASAAIRAGITILLKIAGLRAEDLDAILLAGGFGNFIRRNHARRIGMLPPVPCSRIHFVGNTASLGAKRALLSTQEKQNAAGILGAARHVDLSLDPDFQLEFSTAMMMPETEPAE